MSERSASEQEYTPEQLKALAAQMRDVAGGVYWLFFYAGMGASVHAFIEFCGVLNKYVEICGRCAEAGIDFTQFNTHTGQSMPVEVHDMKYLGEKLQCIFGPIIDANPAAREALKEALFGREAATAEDEAAQ